MCAPGEWERNERKRIQKLKDTILCHSCGWNMEFQGSCSYISTVKCTFGHGDRGIWTIGDNYILKEIPLVDSRDIREVGFDGETTLWLAENTTIPVVREMKHWTDSRSHFFLMNKAPGETLEDAWPKLSTEEKEAYAREVVGYIAQLRTHKAATPQTVNGLPVINNLFGSRDNVVRGVEDKETWWARVRNGLPEKTEEWRNEFKGAYPSHATPYVMTHCDLNAQNIVVHEGRVSAIIDWEFGGYFPDWWEYASAYRGIERSEWRYNILYEMRKQLKFQLGNHIEAAKFCSEFVSRFYEPVDDDVLPYRFQQHFCECKPTVFE